MRSYRYIPVVLALCSAALFLPMHEARAAECPASPLEGVWKNPEAKKQQFVRLKLTQTCGQDGSRRIWVARAWSKCAPRNCTWGKVHVLDDGKPPLRLHFSTYAANRYVEVTRSGPVLHARVFIDYRSRSRKDEISESFLVPEN